MTPTCVTSDTRQEVAESKLRQVVLPETVEAQIHPHQRTSNEYIDQPPFRRVFLAFQYPRQKVLLRDGYLKQRNLDDNGKSSCQEPSRAETAPCRQETQAP